MTTSGQNRARGRCTLPRPRLALQDNYSASGTTLLTPLTPCLQITHNSRIVGVLHSNSSVCSMSVWGVFVHHSCSPRARAINLKMTQALISPRGHEVVMRGETRAKFTGWSSEDKIGLLSEPYQKGRKGEGRSVSAQTGRRQLSKFCLLCRTMRGVRT